MRSTITLFAIMALSIASCLDGDERCKNGNYIWDSKSMSCIDLDLLDTHPAEDGDAGDSEGERVFTGLLEACKSNEDCEGYDSNICAITPTEQTGRCTPGCKSDEECPSEWVCCISAIEQADDICMPTDVFEPIHEWRCVN
jgi:hypothetical protein